jgi:hypothetical protein
MIMVVCVSASIYLWSGAGSAAEVSVRSKAYLICAPTRVSRYFTIGEYIEAACSALSYYCLYSNSAENKSCDQAHGLP